MNKKAQTTIEPDVTTFFIAKLFLFGFVVFGMIQMLSFASPAIGKWITNVVINYFGGVSLGFLFMAAGFIGIALNELVSRLTVGVEPLFTKRAMAFFAVGIVVVAIGFMINWFGPAIGISEQAMHSMILP